MLLSLSSASCLFFFFNDTATTEIYTLSLHDALPISDAGCRTLLGLEVAREFYSAPQRYILGASEEAFQDADRSEEHTSELQSQSNLVCRLLLEKKKK